MRSARSEQAWLDAVRAQVLHGDFPAAEATLMQALTEWPASVKLRRALAGVQQQAGQPAAAESTLRELLVGNPRDAAAAFALARLLKDQGRTSAAASVMRTCFDDARNARDADLAITAIELLDDCDRKHDAAAIAEATVDANPGDARLHAYAGMLAVQMGEFDGARQHYLYALEHDPRAWEWHVPIGLASAQRYREPGHPDFALFRGGLKRDKLSELARAELHFALGKACDDTGDYAEASRHFRQGNAIRHRLTPWSRKAWRRAVEARLASKPLSLATESTQGFTPVFIVGMPRTGTTLLAELLLRRPKVCNRGELPWLARLAQQPGLSGTPDRAMLQRAAAQYARQSRQDDADDAHWFIDKQPLNFRYVDLALAMFPDAKIVRCRRNPRDVALSLWMQCFLEEVQGYSYDLGDIAWVMRDEQRLMEHWRSRHPQAIRDVRYEDLVGDPPAVIADLASWLALPRSDAGAESNTPASTISTASLWQARQPIHSRSVERWHHYAPHVPELLEMPDTRKS